MHQTYTFYLIKAYLNKRTGQFL